MENGEIIIYKLSSNLSHKLVSSVLFNSAWLCSSVFSAVMCSLLHADSAKSIVNNWVGAGLLSKSMWWHHFYITPSIFFYRMFCKRKPELSKN